MLERLELDTRGVREVLKSAEMRQMVNGAALDIQVRVRAKVPPGTRVVLHPYTTDRDAAAVTVEDVRAMAWQARSGILTRAAGEAGVEVRAWGAR
ncbi:hypothetical protein [Actinacidiphila epipremni]|uniref:Uncharacterized protein n=1 Tax=Actinacidiphila epipremni TaxID=2053013 RepID=A0ABX0ZGL7_9ACTN|nr:hypothetical protein [Actinacidiphila epipremni]NJP42272.1 hypothetical protein [Actinacidiphila epipremni]